MIPHLGKPTHWKQGRSAKALADRWFGDRDVPAPVRALLEQEPALAGAELLDGWLERETDLGDGRGSPSETDLLALFGVGDALVLAIEAKVDEPFGDLVGEWLASGGAGKARRLAARRSSLGLEQANVTGLRYQLLHRTAAALIEARRFRATRAVLVIQSFCPDATGLADAQTFFTALRLPGLTPGALIGPVSVSGIALWVGWAADDVPAETSP